jgi:flagellar export protein FliJ
MNRGYLAKAKRARVSARLVDIEISALDKQMADASDGLKRIQAKYEGISRQLQDMSSRLQDTVSGGSTFNCVEYTQIVDRQAILEQQQQVVQKQLDDIEERLNQIKEEKVQKKKKQKLFEKLEARVQDAYREREQKDHWKALDDCLLMERK